MVDAVEVRDGKSLGKFGVECSKMACNRWTPVLGSNDDEVCCKVQYIPKQKGLGTYYEKNYERHREYAWKNHYYMKDKSLQWQVGDIISFTGDTCTAAPTSAPTRFPTPKPTLAPTSEPTSKPTLAPTSAPTDEPHACSHTTCEIRDGSTVVMGEAPEMENWKCNNKGGTCQCLCHYSFKCTIKHHAPEGHVKEMHHCAALRESPAPTPSPTVPTPRPTPAPTFPTPAPTNSCIRYPGCAQNSICDHRGCRKLGGLRFKDGKLVGSCPGYDVPARCCPNKPAGYCRGADF